MSFSVFCFFNEAALKIHELHKFVSKLMNMFSSMLWERSKSILSFSGNKNIWQSYQCHKCAYLNNVLEIVQNQILYSFHITFIAFTFSFEVLSSISMFKMHIELQIFSVNPDFESQCYILKLFYVNKCFKYWDL